MISEPNFPTIIKDFYHAGFYSDTILLSELYLSVSPLNNSYSNSEDIETNSNMLFYLASSYNMLGNVEHSIFILEREKKLCPINAYLLAKLYYNLKKYDQFIQFCVHKISYRPENDNAHLITKKFGKYSGFVMKLLSQYLYTLNKTSQAEVMLNYCLEMNPFLISALIKSVRQDGSRNPFDHFKSFVKSSRKRSSSELDTKPMTHATVQNTNNIENSKYVGDDELEYTNIIEQNHNENTIGIPSKIDPNGNIHSPKQIIGTLAASTPMNIPINTLLQPTKNHDTNTITPIDKTENTNHHVSTITRFKTPQHRFNSIHNYDSTVTHKDQAIRPNIIIHRTKTVHFEDEMISPKLPKNIQFNSSSLSQNNQYTSDSLSLPLPEINAHDRLVYPNNKPHNIGSPSNDIFPNDGYSSPIVGDHNTSNNDIFGDSSTTTYSNEILPFYFNNRSKFYSLPDSLFHEKYPSKCLIIIDAIYKLAKIKYSMFRYDCDQVIRLYDLLPQSIRAVPQFISWLATAHFHKHNYDSCVNIFRHLQMDYPFFCQGFEYYSSALWQNRNIARLEKLACFMKQYMPLCPQTWIVCGNFHNLAKKHDIAIQCFKRTLQMDPKNSYACALLGKEYCEIGHIKEAFLSFKKGLFADRYCYQIWYLISEAHMNKRQFSLAEQCINTAIKINPYDSVVWSMAAAVDFANNHFITSINKIEKAINIDPTNESFVIFKVNILMRIKKWAEARDILINILVENKHTSNTNHVYLLLGKLHLNMEDFQTAENFLTKCIDKDLGGCYCAEARKVMGKIGLLQGGLSSKKNSLLDVRNEHYLLSELNIAKNMADFIQRKDQL